MSSSKTLDQNNTLRNNLVQELLDQNLTLDELAGKFRIDKRELFIWLKNLEAKLHQTIEQPPGLFPEVDDEEWVEMTEDEKIDFINHLKKADEFESETFSIDELDHLKKERTTKNGQ